MCFGCFIHSFTHSFIHSFFLSYVCVHCTAPVTSTQHHQHKGKECVLVLFIHSLVHSFICSFILCKLCVCSLYSSQSPAQRNVFWLFYSLIHSFIHSFVHSFILSKLCVCSLYSSQSTPPAQRKGMCFGCFIHSFTRSFIPSFILSMCVFMYSSQSLTLNTTSTKECVLVVLFIHSLVPSFIYSF